VSDKIPESPPTYTGEEEWPDYMSATELPKKKWVSKASVSQVGGSHYKDMAIQPGHFAQVNRLNAYETYAIKYICRHNIEGLPANKGGRKDIEKAIHCLELLMELDYNEVC